MANVHVKRHPFHLVDPSPWPFLGSLGAFSTVIGAVLYFHGFFKGELILMAGFLQLIFVSFGWWSDVVAEGTFQGCHTKKSTIWIKNGYVFVYCYRSYVFFFFFLGFFPL